MLSLNRNVIPNFFANYRPHDKANVLRRSSGNFNKYYIQFVVWFVTFCKVCSSIISYAIMQQFQFPTLQKMKVLIIDIF